MKWYYLSFGLRGEAPGCGQTDGWKGFTHLFPINKFRTTFILLYFTTRGLVPLSKADADVKIHSASKSCKNVLNQGLSFPTQHVFLCTWEPTDDTQKQSLAWEATSFSSTHKYSAFRRTVIFIVVFTKVSTGPIMSNTNIVKCSKTFLFHIYFNIILPSMLGLQSDIFPSSFRAKLGMYL